DDLRLLAISALAYEGISDHLKAEDIWNRLIVLATECEMKAVMLAGKLSNLIGQADFERFLATLKVYCELPVSNHIKVSQLDRLACIPLYGPLPAEVYGTALQLAEFSVRKALELAPGRVTLKGTLGGCLVELGRSEEAEPILLECYKNGSVLDRAISALFLGFIAEQRNDRSAMAHFARESTLLLAPRFLAERAKSFRARVEQKDVIFQSDIIRKICDAPSMQLRKYVALGVGLLLAIATHFVLEEIRLRGVQYPEFRDREKSCSIHNVPLESIFSGGESVTLPNGGVGALCYRRKICVPCNQAARRPEFLYLVSHWSTMLGMVAFPMAVAVTARPKNALT
ncbi:MAG TPA: hypothetical protein VK633_13670, partial [Verrucomicrobiae bacterium]|nr:hypothetical protein [Verrucomicrobiae bacterium]